MKNRRFFNRRICAAAQIRAFLAAHNELIKLDGKYAAMWKAQAGKYAESFATA